MVRTTLALLVLAAASSPVLGCSGDTGDGYVAPASDPNDQSEDALSTTGSSLVPGVAAIEFSISRPPPAFMMNTDPIIAAPSKIKKVMSALAKRSANRNVPACGGILKTTHMRFLDATGKEIATGEYTCAYGSIRIGGSEIEIVANTGAIDDVRAADRVPADVLFGVDNIKIARPGQGAAVVVKKAEDVKSILGAIDLEHLAPIDPHAPSPRCLPSAVLTFNKKQAELAVATYLCSASSPTAKVDAVFESGPGVEVATKGTTTIDPRVVQRIFEAP